MTSRPFTRKQVKKYIEDWLEANGETHEGLAEMIGRSRITISNLVNMHSDPRRSTIDKLTAAGVLPSDDEGDVSTAALPLKTIRLLDEFLVEATTYLRSL